MTANLTEKEQEVERLNIEEAHKVIYDKRQLNKWKANIWKSYLFHFFMGIHLISGVLIPFFLTWGRINYVEVMLLQSIFTMVMLLLEIPSGAIADYIGRKFSLILGALVNSIAALIYGSYPSIFIFAIGETLWAFAGALISGTDQALVYDTLRKLNKEEEISKVMARNRSFMLIGIGISAPVGSFIGAYLSLNLVMTFMFFPFIIATLVAFTLREPNHELEKKNHEKYLIVIKSGFKELRENKILRIIAFDMITTEAIVSFLIWIYQLYLKALNFQLVLYGFVSTSMTLIQILFYNIVPKLESKVINKRRFLLLFTTIPGVGFILLAVIYVIPISIPLILTIIGFGFSRRVIFLKSINKQIETQNRATVL
ncbi:MAG: MFS transporter, partial [Candidatus Thorarchaeota archaeon]